MAASSSETATQPRVWPPWAEAFLAALAQRPSVSCAAIAAGVQRRLVYAYRAQDETFANAWDDALESHLDRLEGNLFERAADGWEEPLAHEGRLTGDSRQRFDNRLGEWWLERRRAERFAAKAADDAQGPAAGGTGRVVLLIEGAASVEVEALRAEVVRLRARVAELEGQAPPDPGE